MFTFQPSEIGNPIWDKSARSGGLRSGSAFHGYSHSTLETSLKSTTFSFFGLSSLPSATLCWAPRTGQGSGEVYGSSDISADERECSSQGAKNGKDRTF